MVAKGRRTRWPLGLLGLLVAGVACALLPPSRPLMAQEPIAGAFGETVDVRVVNVEVVVEDRAGARVTSLQARDFRLFVDGKETPIDYFTEVREGDAVSAAEPAAGTLPGMPSLGRDGGAVGTSYLVFIDDFFSIARDRNLVIEALSRQVEALAPADRVAVVAYDGKRLEMLTSWSQSVPALQRALRDAIARPAFGLQRQSERRTALRDLSISRQTFGRQRVLTPVDLPVRDYVERLSNQVERSVDAATAALRGFASPPGRKVMLLLSGGWPMEPTQTVLSPQQIAAPERDIKSGADLFRPLVDTANLLGYTTYPVDVPGLEGEGETASAATVEDRDFFSDFGRSHELETQASLQFVAKQTGGRALLNARRSEVFASVTNDLRSYYWLGFSPARKGDERQRNLRVEVARPGLRVRTRENFRDMSRKREINNAVESALLFGNPPSAAPLAVTVGKPERDGRRVKLPLQVSIPLDRIAMVPIEGKYVAQLEVRLGALDAEGNRSEITVVPLRIERQHPAAAGSLAPFATAIELRRVEQHLIVAVYDVATGAMLSTTLEVKP
jgi:VWFA-related protein